MFRENFQALRFGLLSIISVFDTVVKTTENVSIYYLKAKMVAKTDCKKSAVLLA